MKNYYKILGVCRDATPDEIKSAYRRLSKDHHPDVSKEGEISSKRFQEINDAYEVLGDEIKRKSYDANFGHSVVIDLDQSTKELVNEFLGRLR